MKIRIKDGKAYLHNGDIIGVVDKESAPFSVVKTPDKSYRLIKDNEYMLQDSFQIINLSYLDKGIIRVKKDNLFYLYDQDLNILIDGNGYTKINLPGKYVIPYLDNKCTIWFENQPVLVGKEYDDIRNWDYDYIWVKDGEIERVFEYETLKELFPNESCNKIQRIGMRIDNQLFVITVKGLHYFIYTDGTKPFNGRAYTNIDADSSHKYLICQREDLYDFVDINYSPSEIKLALEGISQVEVFELRETGDQMKVFNTSVLAEIYSVIYEGEKRIYCSSRVSYKPSRLFENALIGSISFDGIKINLQADYQQKQIYLLNHDISII